MLTRKLKTQQATVHHGSSLVLVEGSQCARIQNKSKAQKKIETIQNIFSLYKKNPHTPFAHGHMCSRSRRRCNARATLIMSEWISTPSSGPGLTRTARQHFVCGVAAKQTPRRYLFCSAASGHPTGTLSAESQRGYSRRECPKPEHLLQSRSLGNRSAHTRSRQRKVQMWMWLPTCGWLGSAVPSKALEKQRCRISDEFGGASSWPGLPCVEPGGDRSSSRRSTSFGRHSRSVKSGGRCWR